MMNLHVIRCWPLIFDMFHLDYLNFIYSEQLILKVYSVLWCFIILYAFHFALFLLSGANVMIHLLLFHTHLIYSIVWGKNTDWWVVSSLKSFSPLEFKHAKASPPVKLKHTCRWWHGMLWMYHCEMDYISLQGPVITLMPVLKNSSSGSWH